jgi:hypothetical protein
MQIDRDSHGRNRRDVRGLELFKKIESSKDLLSCCSDFKCSYARCAGYEVLYDLGIAQERVNNHRNNEYLLTE